MVVRAFETLRLLVKGHLETIIENFILAETTELSHKDSASHLPRVTGRSLDRELNQETWEAIETSFLPNPSSFLPNPSTREMHSIESILLLQDISIPLAAEAGVPKFTMDLLDHLDKQGIRMTISISPEIAEVVLRNLSGKVTMFTTIAGKLTTIAKTFVMPQTIGIISLKAFVITETTVVIAIRIRCRSMIIGTTLDTETVFIGSPMQQQDMLVMAPTTGSLSPRAFASTENTVAIVSHSSHRISKTVPTLQVPPSETESSFLATETLLMFLLGVSLKISLQRSRVIGLSLRGRSISQKLCIHKCEHRASRHMPCHIRPIAVSLRRLHPWSSSIARSTISLNPAPLVSRFQCLPVLSGMLKK